MSKSEHKKTSDPTEINPHDEALLEVVEELPLLEGEKDETKEDISLLLKGHQPTPEEWAKQQHKENTDRDHELEIEELEDIIL